jgi:hypothetical protein
MNQMMLNSTFHQSFIVNIQFWQPGVYTYQTEAVFKNRIGQYAPIPIGEPRTIMIRDASEMKAGQDDVPILPDVNSVPEDKARSAEPIPDTPPMPKDK